jgi:hypothetical protein
MAVKRIVSKLQMLPKVWILDLAPPRQRWGDTVIRQAQMAILSLLSASRLSPTVDNDANSRTQSIY